MARVAFEALFQQAPSRAVSRAFRLVRTGETESEREQTQCRPALGRLCNRLSIEGLLGAASAAALSTAVLTVRRCAINHLAPCRLAAFGEARVSAPAPAASLGNTLPFKDQEDYKVRLVLAWQVCNKQ